MVKKKTNLPRTKKVNEPINFFSNCQTERVQKLYIELIFEQADFRNIILDALARYGRDPIGFSELLTRLQQIIDEMKQGGLAEARPEFIDEFNRYEEFFNGQLRKIEYSNTLKSSESIKIFVWPDPSKGKQFGGSLYKTIPAAKNDKILDKKTKIASGGGCLNYLFIDKLIERQYNYVCKELNYDPKTGTMTGDYDAKIGPRQQGACNWGVMFNTAAYAQIADLAFADEEPDPVCVKIQEKPPRFTDPFRCGVYFPSVDAFNKNRKVHIKHTQELLKEVDVFLAFLGNNEGAIYLPDNRYMSTIIPETNILPVSKQHVFTVQENIDLLSHFIDVVTEQNPTIKFLLGVTPTPLLATSQLDRHVVEANYLGKSTLRVVAEEVVTKYDNAYYFPSFESGWECILNPTGEDGRHATEETLNRMADTFEARFAK